MLIEEAVEQFNEFPAEFKAVCSDTEFVEIMQELERSYGLDSLSPVIVFFAIGELAKEDISDYLENEYDLSTDVAERLANELIEKILDPAYEHINFINSHPDKEMSLEQEKLYVENMFRSGLVKELERNPLLIRAANMRLFYILSRDPLFQKTLEKALYTNEETLSTRSLVSNGESQRPTVGNWIKEYVSNYGSEIGNTVNASNFLINSGNVKDLSDAERKRLAAVLKTYVNIKFFPDSMPAGDRSVWEIIPSGESDELAMETVTIEASFPRFDQQSPAIQSPVSINGTSLTDNIEARNPSRVTASQPELVSAPAPIQAVPPQSVAPRVVPRRPRPGVSSTLGVAPLSKPLKPIKKRAVVAASTTQNSIPVESDVSLPSEELMNLKNMLLQYPAGSLERKAIEDEIKKLS